MTKVCSRCKEELEVSLFYKNKLLADGYTSVCKSCFKKRRIELKKSDKQAILSTITRLRKIENEILSKDGLLLCTNMMCSNIVELRGYRCKKCCSEEYRKKFAKNKEKFKESNREANRKYREKNREKIKEYQKKYRERKKLEKATNNNQSV